MDIFNLNLDQDLINLDIEDNEEDKVYIKIQPRSGRKNLTIIYGLAVDLDLKKILKFLKKTLNCNGVLLDDEEFGKILQLQGNHKDFIKEFLKTELKYKEINILIKN
jgi:translation initiation factor 1